MVKNLPAVQETGFDPWVRKIPWKGNGYRLQYSCLENTMDRGAWWAIYSPWGLKELDTTERLTHTSFIPISSPSPNQLPQNSSLPCLCPILVQAITACSLVSRVAASLNPSHPASDFLKCKLDSKWRKSLNRPAQPAPCLLPSQSPALTALHTALSDPCAPCASFCDRAFAHALLLPDSSPTTEVLFRSLLRNCSKELAGKVNLHAYILVRKYKLLVYFLVKDYCQSQRTDFSGTSLAVQQLGLHASTAGGTGLIPGQGTKIAHAPRCGPKQTKTENKNKKQRTVFSN